MVRKHTHKLDSESNLGAVPPTPSKILFSPCLRTTDSLGNQSNANQLLVSDDSDFSSTDNHAFDGESKDIVVSTATECDDEVEDDIFNPYTFIGGLPHHNVAKICDKVCLPYNTSRSLKNATLVLDLDETLVHCTVDPIEKPDLVFPVSFNGNVYQVYVRKRPYLDYFLETVSKTFEVVVFTASQKVYADVLLDQIDPEKKVYRSSSVSRSMSPYSRQLFKRSNCHTARY
jgi:CTD small phosphatase-like protein 2